MSAILARLREYALELAIALRDADLEDADTRASLIELVRTIAESYEELVASDSVPNVSSETNGTPTRWPIKPTCRAWARAAGIAPSTLWRVINKDRAADGCTFKERVRSDRLARVYALRLQQGGTVRQIAATLDVPSSTVMRDIALLRRILNSPYAAQFREAVKPVLASAANTEGAPLGVQTEDRPMSERQ
jgi:hypothetical protein